MVLKRLVNGAVYLVLRFTSMSMQMTSKEVKANTVRKIITLRLSFRGSQWLGELLLMTPVVVGLAIAALGEKAPMRILHDIISIPILM